MSPREPLDRYFQFYVLLLYVSPNATAIQAIQHRAKKTYKKYSGTQHRYIEEKLLKL